MASDPFDSEAPRFDQPPPVPRRGMSSTAKVLLGLGIGCGTLTLLCCGGVGFAIYQFMPTVTVTDADVEAVTRKMSSIKIPDSFEPVRAIHGENAFFTVRMTEYRHVDGRGLLALLQTMLHFDGGQANADEVHVRFEQEIEGLRRLNVQETEEREFEINGQTVAFEFAVAEDPHSNTIYRQVRGSFPGREGTVELILQVEEAAWDEEAVVKMLESIE